MAKEGKPEPKIEVPKKPKKESYTPKLRLLYGLAIVVVAAMKQFNWYTFPSWLINLLMFIAGLWLFISAIKWGFIERRKHLLKKYI